MAIPAEVSETTFLLQKFMQNIQLAYFPYEKLYFTI